MDLLKSPEGDFVHSVAVNLFAKSCREFIRQELLRIDSPRIAVNSFAWRAPGILLPGS
jgi:hypothetical protein